LVKVVLSCQNNSIHKNTYIIINASNDGIYVEFERKKEHNLGLPNFKLPTSTKKGLKTYPLNSIFDIFSICLLV